MFGKLEFKYPMRAGEDSSPKKNYKRCPDCIRPQPRTLHCTSSRHWRRNFLEVFWPQHITTTALLAMHISATSEIRVFLGWLPPFRHLAWQIGQWFLRKQQEKLRVMSEKTWSTFESLQSLPFKSRKYPTREISVALCVHLWHQHGNGKWTNRRSIFSH